MAPTNKPLMFVFHGLKHNAAGARFIPIGDINEFAKEPDIPNNGTGACILGEIIIVVELGTNKYKLLGDSKKYLEDLIVAKARTVLCVVLTGLLPIDEEVIGEQSKLLPPIPLLVDPGDAAVGIYDIQNLYHTFDNAYPRLLGNITSPSKIASAILGTKLFTDRGIRKRKNQDKATKNIKKASKAKTSSLAPKGEYTSSLMCPELKRDYDERAAKQRHGLNLDQVVSLLSTPEKIDDFLLMITNKLVSDTFDEAYPTIHKMTKYLG